MRALPAWSVASSHRLQHSAASAAGNSTLTAFGASYFTTFHLLEFEFFCVWYSHVKHLPDSTLYMTEPTISELRVVNNS